MLESVLQAILLANLFVYFLLHLLIISTSFIQ